jgi:subtilisin family serine protease
MSFYTSYLPLALRDHRPRLDPNDPWYVGGLQWALQRVEAPYGWAASNGEGVIVAILDSGVDLDHPDLSDSLWINPGEVVGNGVDDDGNGYVDDLYGWDFIGYDNLPGDGNGHGTHVAGIAGATTDNGIGIAGLGWGVTLMPVRVLDSSGSGTTWSVAQGIRYAVDQGALAVNLSLGGYGGDSTLEQAVQYAQSKGALVVAAAGNHNTSEAFYPAAYAGVLGVAATRSDDQKWPFSNYGPHVDLAAPGAAIYSTVPGAGYGDMSGTSMAAPIVSGLAALVWAKYPSATAAEVAAMIADGAEDLGSAGWDPYYGWGRVNAPNALYGVSGAGGEAELSAGPVLETKRSSEVKSSHPGRGYVPGELIVRVRSSPSAEQVDGLLAAGDVSVLRADERSGLYLLRVERGQEIAVALALQQDGNVVYVHPNYVLSAAR